MGKREEVVSIANKELSLGISGRPNKYTNWYGLNGEWCAMFVSWVFNQAGVSTDSVPKTASVSTFLSEAQKQGRYYSKQSGYNPVGGDIVIFKNGMSHVGLVTGWDGRQFTTVEGNTGSYPGKVSSGKYSLGYSGLSGFFSPNISGNGTAPSKSKTINLPSGLGGVFTYMGWQTITSSGSLQYKLRSQAGQNFDSEGFGIINGRYVVACTTTFGAVGDYIDVYQSNGNVIKCVIGDIKNQNDSGCNKWGHLDGKCVIEFVVDKDSWYSSKHANPGTSSCHPEWGGQTITKIINCGNYFDGSGATGTSSSDKIELCSTRVVSTVNTGTSAAKAKGIYQSSSWGFKFELHIINKGIDYVPIVVDTVTWTTEYIDTCGKLTFTVLNDKKIDFTEGSIVIFKVHDKGVFYGYIFEKSKTQEGNIKCTAYDQLRYFKNKDTYCYRERKYSDLIKIIANDNLLTVGEIDDTGCLITRIEDNVSLFDMCKNAREVTSYTTGQLFVLYDDFGKIALKNIKALQTNYWLTLKGYESFEYKTSIDNNVYNRIQCYIDNDSTGERSKYISVADWEAKKLATRSMPFTFTGIKVLSTI